MKIGMVGGIGPESTLDYYKRLIVLYQERVSEKDYPEIVINSINMTAMLKLVADKDWYALTTMLENAVDLLYRAGAGIAFMASNTPHIVFDRLLQVSPIPLVSIVEATAEEAKKRGLKKAGLLGTFFTMQNRYYEEEFEKSGIEMIVPSGTEQRYIQEKLDTEIERGIFCDDTRNGFLQIVKRLKDEEAIDGVILGCTEIPLILTQDEFGLPFLNTTEIHVNRIFEEYIELNRR